MFVHHQHIKEVFKWLWKAGLYIKVEKCEFYSELVEYLEYILSSFRLTMLDDKIRTINNCLKLKKVKNIQFFLGFANFYHSIGHTPFYYLLIQGLKTLYSFQFHRVLNDNLYSAQ